MTLVQYLTAVTIGCGGGVVVFWIYQLGLRVLAWREAKADAAGWAADEAARMAPIHALIDGLLKTYGAFVLGEGSRPARLVVPPSEMPALYVPRSSFSDVTVKAFIEGTLGVEVVAGGTSMHFEGAST